MRIRALVRDEEGGDAMHADELHAGRLTAVIDFVPGLADPATVCLAAWNVLPASHRARFRAGLGLDAAAWHRGIGWALLQAVIALPYYRRTNPGMTRMAVHALRELVADASA